MVQKKKTKIKIFVDGVSLADFNRLNKVSLIKGFTTNPSLMRKANVRNYEQFVKDVAYIVRKKPVSLEVISDDFDEMERQARKLSAHGKNIYVKIPITNTKGQSSAKLVKRLLDSGIKVNVTAIMTVEQIKRIKTAVMGKTPVIISIFAGRIADTGVDPIPLIKKARQVLKNARNVEFLWASPREVFNIFQAEEAGCDIITVWPDIVAKMHLVGHDLNAFSLDTVKMFYNDAVASGYVL
ncbi:MAG TPA: transaldolase [Candidatus Omnitrophota bacterium]|nr:transaldolase [Candidatus Omnitrophota bacterium]HPS20101.1 transaldolase [Candidatus Omnitrophota bacterium]